MKKTKNSEGNKQFLHCFCNFFTVFAQNSATKLNHATFANLILSPIT
jgi:hypothetical protein